MRYRSADGIGAAGSLFSKVVCPLVPPEAGVGSYPSEFNCVVGSQVVENVEAVGGCSLFDD